MGEGDPRRRHQARVTHERPSRDHCDPVRAVHLGGACPRFIAGTDTGRPPSRSRWWCRSRRARPSTCSRGLVRASSANRSADVIVDNRSGANGMIGSGIVRPCGARRLYALGVNAGLPRDRRASDEEFGRRSCERLHADHRGGRTVTALVSTPNCRSNSVQELIAFARPTGQAVLRQLGKARCSI